MAKLIEVALRHRGEPKRKAHRVAGREALQECQGLVLQEEGTV